MTSNQNKQDCSSNGNGTIEEPVPSSAATGLTDSEKEENDAVSDCSAKFCIFRRSFGRGLGNTDLSSEIEPLDSIRPVHSEVVNSSTLESNATIHPNGALTIADVNDCGPESPELSSVAASFINPPVEQEHHRINRKTWTPPMWPLTRSNVRRSHPYSSYGQVAPSSQTNSESSGLSIAAASVFEPLRPLIMTNVRPSEPPLMTNVRPSEPPLTETNVRRSHPYSSYGQVAPSSQTNSESSGLSIVAASVFEPTVTNVHRSEPNEAIHLAVLRSLFDAKTIALRTHRRAMLRKQVISVVRYLENTVRADGDESLRDATFSAIMQAETVTAADMNILRDLEMERDRAEYELSYVKARITKSKQQK